MAEARGLATEGLACTGKAWVSFLVGGVSALTQYHRPADKCISQSSRGRASEVRGRQGSSDLQMACSRSTITWQSRGEGAGSRLPLLRAPTLLQGSTLRTSSQPNHLPKTPPPNAIGLP